MADAPKPVDPNALARRLLAGLCFAGIFMLLTASVVIPSFHVDVTLIVVLAITGSALVGVDLKLWGP